MISVILSEDVLSTQHNASPKQNKPETLNQSITTSPKLLEDKPNYVINSIVSEPQQLSVIPTQQPNNDNTDCQT